jgi:hypothetical protein
MEFSSNSGLKTKMWGPSGWDFLFSCIMGGYPYKLDFKDKEHLLIKKHFKALLGSLRYTLPCVFCRESYQKFWKELPIEKHLTGRLELMYWLYLIKDKVNNKLMNQEQEAHDEKMGKLNYLFRMGKITRNDFMMHQENIKNTSFCTKPSPPFIEVLQMYESRRAGCSKKAKSCN